MSYSFTVQAPTKAEAKVLVRDKLNQAADIQHCHTRDKVQAAAAADAFIDLLADDEARDVVVNMNGHLSGIWHGSDVAQISQAAVAVSAGLVDRKGG